MKFCIYIGNMQYILEKIRCLGAASLFLDLSVSKPTNLEVLNLLRNGDCTFMGIAENGDFCFIETFSGFRC